VSELHADAELAARVRELTAEHAGLEPAEISLACHLQNDLSLDSLDQIELAMAFEQAFGVTIEDRQIQQVRTVGQAVELVQSLRRQASEQVARESSPRRVVKNKTPRRRSVVDMASRGWRPGPA